MMEMITLSQLCSQLDKFGSIEVANNSSESYNCTEDIPGTDYPLTPLLSLTAGVICIIVALFGAVGNLLTLLAIPWAQRNKILGFDRTPLKYTTIFMVNLAFADFLYCVTNLPMYSLTYLSMEWPGSSDTCFAFAAFRYFNAFAAWMSLGFVAFSRCLSLTYPELSKAVSIKHRNLMMVVGIWIYALVMVIPTIMGKYGTFGYAKDLGKCDYITKDGIDPRVLFYSLGFGLPFILIVVSYFGIWRTTTKSSLFLKLNSIMETRKQIQSREMKMTWTLFGMSFCYVIFVAPIFFCSIFNILGDWNLICFILYWFQYTLNFVIYAARSEQYRTAYLRYLKKKFPLLFGIHKSRKHNTIFIINPGISPAIRRTASNPELYKNKIDKNKEMDVKLEYSLDLEYEKIIHSYTGSIKVERVTTPTIIILPGELKQSYFSAKSSLGSEADKMSRLEFNWKKKTKFEEVDEDEMSSEGQVETTGIDKEYRSEYCPNYLETDDTLMKRAFSF